MSMKMEYKSQLWDKVDEAAEKSQKKIEAELAKYGVDLDNL